MRTLAASFALTLGATAAMGCGVGNGAAGSGSDAGSPDGGDVCSLLSASACSLRPAAPSDAAATTITTPHTYAIQKLYFGDTSRSGVASTTAWPSARTSCRCSCRSTAPFHRTSTRRSPRGSSPG